MRIPAVLLILLFGDIVSCKPYADGELEVNGQASVDVQANSGGAAVAEDGSPSAGKGDGVNPIEKILGGFDSVTPKSHNGKSHNHGGDTGPRDDYFEVFKKKILEAIEGHHRKQPVELLSEFIMNGLTLGERIINELVTRIHQLVHGLSGGHQHHHWPFDSNGGNDVDVLSIGLQKLKDVIACLQNPLFSAKREKEDADLAKDVDTLSSIVSKLVALKGERSKRSALKGADDSSSALESEETAKIAAEAAERIRRALFSRDYLGKNQAKYADSLSSSAIRRILQQAKANLHSTIDRHSFNDDDNWWIINPPASNVRVEFPVARSRAKASATAVAKSDVVDDTRDGHGVETLPEPSVESSTGHKTSDSGKWGTGFTHEPKYNIIWTENGELLLGGKVAGGNKGSADQDQLDQLSPQESKVQVASKHGTKSSVPVEKVHTEPSTDSEKETVSTQPAEPSEEVPADESPAEKVGTTDEAGVQEQKESSVRVIKNPDVFTLFPLVLTPIDTHIPTGMTGSYSGVQNDRLHISSQSSSDAVATSDSTSRVGEDSVAYPESTGDVEAGQEEVPEEETEVESVPPTESQATVQQVEVNDGAKGSTIVLRDPSDFDFDPFHLVLTPGQSHSHAFRWRSNGKHSSHGLTAKSHGHREDGSERQPISGKSTVSSPVETSSGEEENVQIARGDASADLAKATSDADAGSDARGPDDNAPIEHPAASVEEGPGENGESGEDAEKRLEDVAPVTSPVLQSPISSNEMAAPAPIESGVGGSTSASTAPLKSSADGKDDEKLSENKTDDDTAGDEGLSNQATGIPIGDEQERSNEDEAGAVSRSDATAGASVDTSVAQQSEGVDEELGEPLGTSAGTLKETVGTDVGAAAVGTENAPSSSRPDDGLLKLSPAERGTSTAAASATGRAESSARKYVDSSDKLLRTAPEATVPSDASEPREDTLEPRIATEQTEKSETRPIISSASSSAGASADGELQNRVGGAETSSDLSSDVPEETPASRTDKGHGQATNKESTPIELKTTTGDERKDVSLDGNVVSPSELSAVARALGVGVQNGKLDQHRLLNALLGADISKWTDLKPGLNLHNVNLYGHGVDADRSTDRGVPGKTNKPYYAHSSIALPEMNFDTAKHGVGTDRDAERTKYDLSFEPGTITKTSEHVGANDGRQEFKSTLSSWSGARSDVKGVDYKISLPDRKIPSIEYSGVGVHDATDWSRGAADQKPPVVRYKLPTSEISRANVDVEHAEWGSRKGPVAVPRGPDSASSILGSGDIANSVAVSEASADATNRGIDATKHKSSVAEHRKASTEPPVETSAGSSVKTASLPESAETVSRPIARTDDNDMEIQSGTGSKAGSQGAPSDKTNEDLSENIATREKPALSRAGGSARDTASGPAEINKLSSPEEADRDAYDKPAAGAGPAANNAPTAGANSISASKPLVGRERVGEIAGGKFTANEPDSEGLSGASTAVSSAELESASPAESASAGGTAEKIVPQDTGSSRAGEPSAALNKYENTAGNTAASPGVSVGAIGSALSDDNVHTGRNAVDVPRATAAASATPAGARTKPNGDAKNIQKSRGDADVSEPSKLSFDSRDGALEKAGRKLPEEKLVARPLVGSTAASDAASTTANAPIGKEASEDINNYARPVKELTEINGPSREGTSVNVKPVTTASTGASATASAASPTTASAPIGEDASRDINNYARPDKELISGQSREDTSANVKPVTTSSTGASANAPTIASAPIGKEAPRDINNYVRPDIKLTEISGPSREVTSANVKPVTTSSTGASATAPTIASAPIGKEASGDVNNYVRPDKELISGQSREDTSANVKPVTTSSTGASANAPTIASAPIGKEAPRDINNYVRPDIKLTEISGPSREVTSANVKPVTTSSTGASATAPTIASAPIGKEASGDVNNYAQPDKKLTGISGPSREDTSANVKPVTTASTAAPTTASAPIGKEAPGDINNYARPDKKLTEISGPSREDTSANVKPATTAWTAASATAPTAASAPIGKEAPGDINNYAIPDKKLTEISGSPREDTSANVRPVTTASTAASATASAAAPTTANAPIEKVAPGDINYHAQPDKKLIEISGPLREDASANVKPATTASTAASAAAPTAASAPTGKETSEDTNYYARPDKMSAVSDKAIPHAESKASANAVARVATSSDQLLDTESGVVPLNKLSSSRPTSPETSIVSPESYSPAKKGDAKGINVSTDVPAHSSQSTRQPALNRDTWLKSRSKSPNEADSLGIGSDEISLDSSVKSASDRAATESPSKPNPKAESIKPSVNLLDRGGVAHGELPTGVQSPHWSKLYTPKQSGPELIVDTPKSSGSDKGEGVSLVAGNENDELTDSGDQSVAPAATSSANVAPDMNNLPSRKSTPKVAVPSASSDLPPVPFFHVVPIGAERSSRPAPESSRSHRPTAEASADAEASTAAVNSDRPAIKRLQRPRPSSGTKSAAEAASHGEAWNNSLEELGGLAAIPKPAERSSPDRKADEKLGEKPWKPWKPLRYGEGKSTGERGKISDVDLASESSPASADTVADSATSEETPIPSPTNLNDLTQQQLSPSSKSLPKPIAKTGPEQIEDAKVQPKASAETAGNAGASASGGDEASDSSLALSTASPGPKPRGGANDDTTAIIGALSRGQSGDGGSRAVASTDADANNDSDRAEQLAPADTSASKGAIGTAVSGRAVNTGKPDQKSVALSGVSAEAGAQGRAGAQGGAAGRELSGAPPAGLSDARSGTSVKVAPGAPSREPWPSPKWPGEETTHSEEGTEPLEELEEPETDVGSLDDTGAKPVDGLARKAPVAGSSDSPDDGFEGGLLSSPRTGWRPLISTRPISSSQTVGNDDIWREGETVGRDRLGQMISGAPSREPLPSPKWPGEETTHSDEGTEPLEELEEPETDVGSLDDTGAKPVDGLARKAPVAGSSDSPDDGFEGGLLSSPGTGWRPLLPTRPKPSPQAVGNDDIWREDETAAAADDDDDDKQKPIDASPRDNVAVRPGVQSNSGTEGTGRPSKHPHVAQNERDVARKPISSPRLRSGVNYIPSDGTPVQTLKGLSDAGRGERPDLNIKPATVAIGDGRARYPWSIYETGEKFALPAVRGDGPRDLAGIADGASKNSHGHVRRKQLTPELPAFSSESDDGAGTRATDEPHFDKSLDRSAKLPEKGIISGAATKPTSQLSVASPGKGFSVPPDGQQAVGGSNLGPLRGPSTDDASPDDKTSPKEPLESLPLEKSTPGDIIADDATNENKPSPGDTETGVAAVNSDTRHADDDSCPETPAVDIYVVRRTSDGPVGVTKIEDSVPPIVSFRLIPRYVYEKIRKMGSNKQLTDANYLLA